MIKTLIKHTDTCLFVSPHFDDAVFSVGGYLSEVIDPKRAIVVNVFTQGGSKMNTLSARAYLSQCGYPDSTELYKLRDKEDTNALTQMGIRKVNLGLVEALWRKRNFNSILNFIGKLVPEVAMMYPTYAYHVIRGQVHSDDNKTIEVVTKKLQKIVDKNSIDIVFAPLAIGNHIDHRVVRLAVEKLNNVRIIGWEDYPYNLVLDHSVLANSVTYKPNWRKKVELMKKYQTQFNAVFPEGAKSKNEVFVPLL